MGHHPLKGPIFIVQKEIGLKIIPNPTTVDLKIDPWLDIPKMMTLIVTIAKQDSKWR